MTQGGMFRSVWRRFIERHPVGVAISIIAVAAFVVAARAYYVQVLRHPLVLLTGLEGSNLGDIGNLLNIRFSNEPLWRTWGRTFSLTPQATQGAQENRRRVNDDLNAMLLGFAYDGFDESSNVRTIHEIGPLPLIILVGKKFRDELPKGKGGPPNTLRALTQNLHPPGAAFRPCRIYLGPSRSGTREIASKVLDSVDVPIESHDTLAYLDFTAAALALRGGQLDIAFFMVPVDSPLIHDLCHHGEASLVGLDEVDGIVEAMPQLRKYPLQTGLVAHDHPDSTLYTVSATMILVCSNSMSHNDGYWLARSIDTYLGDESPGDGNGTEHATTPNGSATATPAAAQPLETTMARRYPMHTGAKQYQDGRSPWYVVATERSVIWLLGAIVLGPLTGYAPRAWRWLFRPRPGDISQSASPLGLVNDDVPEIRKRIENLRERIKIAPDFALAELAELYRHERVLRRRATAARSPSATSMLKHDINVLNDALRDLDQFRICRLEESRGNQVPHAEAANPFE